MSIDDFIKKRPVNVGNSYHMHADQVELAKFPKMKPCLAAECFGVMERIGIMYCCMNPKCNRVLEIEVRSRTSKKKQQQEEEN